ncbi:DUF4913 domain-containing protein [Pseudactinotalea sp. Z1748]|uniref:DUF4913 domain-containing protein n=1 Tax=Pseudactinotalea sp. Z1748 TaxID=3413027 RepID=UPI003C7AA940
MSQDRPQGWMPEDDIPIEELAAALEGDDHWSDKALADRTGGQEVIGPAIINWREIETETRNEAAQHLIDWVHGWLIPRYALQDKDLPECWWRHGMLIEELSALHTAWLVAFHETDGGNGPIGWHERFALARTRMKVGCAAGVHRDKPLRRLPKVDPGEL